MALPTPVLDDRSFQDIVDELKRRIPHYCPEWTDHNVSDPGVTLIELYAWVAKALLFQMNQVPDLHYIKLMELLGIHLRPAEAARVPVTIWLSKDQDNTIEIERGFEVASTQTEHEQSIVFTTETDLLILPVTLAAVVSRFARGESPSLQPWPAEYVPAFSEPPQAGDALEFGFDQDVSAHILQFSFRFHPNKGAGPDEYRPESWPYVWEVLTQNEENSWQACFKEYDETKAMRYSGRMQIHLPIEHKCKMRNGRYWVRLRVAAGERFKGFQDSPILLNRPIAASVGGSVWAHHANTIHRERIGISDGTPGQVFSLSEQNLLPATLALQTEMPNGKHEMWQETRTFAFSDDKTSSDQRAFTVNRQTGEIRFAPAIRESNGDIQQYGAIPPSGAEIYVAEYQYGGGIDGNVAAGKLDTAKTAHPFVARVRNLQAATGGFDAEDVHTAKMRVPLHLRTRDRAVTAQDFEMLAKAASRSVARAKCLVNANAPNSVTVYLLPHRPRVSAATFPLSDLSLRPAEQATIEQEIDRRRMLTVHVATASANLIPVVVELYLDPIARQHLANWADVAEQLQRRLDSYIDPWTGGDEGTGWPFGHPLRVEDISRCLHGVSAAFLIRQVHLYRGDPETGHAVGESQSAILIEANSTLISGSHRIN